jgi:hypothetical protein
VFGTNSEANSLSVEERMELLEALVQGGVPPETLMPGTGCCALTDSVRLTGHAVALGCGGADAAALTTRACRTRGSSGRSPRSSSAWRTSGFACTSITSPVAGGDRLELIERL